MSKGFLVLFNVSVVLLNCLFWSGSAAAEASPPSIGVSGSCVRTVKPDLAEVFIGIRSRNADAGKAMATALPVYEKILKTIKALKLKDGELNTTDLGVNRLTDYVNGKQVDKGFEAHYSFNVSTTEIARVGEIFKIAHDGGANDISGPRFGLSKELYKKEYETCLDEAGRNAREKAEVIAKSMGVTLTGKMIVQENGGQSYQPPMEAGDMGGGMMKVMGAPPIETKKQDVQVNLGATFFVK